ncbi:hypothetical protein ACHAQA_000133 [Verticillium albo-atrum]
MHLRPRHQPPNRNHHRHRVERPRLHVLRRRKGPNQHPNPGNLHPETPPPRRTPDDKAGGSTPEQINNPLLQNHAGCASDRTPQLLLQEGTSMRRTWFTRMASRKDVAAQAYPSANSADQIVAPAGRVK